MATRSTKLSGNANRKSWDSRTNPPQFAMGSPVVSDDERLDADTILVAQLRGRSRQASESQVKSHLKEEADTVATKPENSLVYANVRGFSVLDNLENFIKKVDAQARELKDQRLRIEELTKESQREIGELNSAARVFRNRIEMLESEAEESKTKIDTQDNNLLDLEGRVTDLTLISEGYLTIRMRFLDIYNKKVKRDPAFQQTPEIEAGNMRAHDGDARVDALLFRDQRRTKDPGTYKELYGVDHSKTLEFADPAANKLVEGLVLRALNARATKVAQKKPFSPDLEAAFNLYVAHLYQKGIEGVGKVKSKFWKLYSKEYPLGN